MLNDNKIVLTAKCRWLVIPLYVLLIYAAYIVAKMAIVNQQQNDYYVRVFLLIISVVFVLFDVWLMMYGTMTVTVNATELVIRILGISKAYDIKHITKIVIDSRPSHGGRCERMFLYFDDRELKLPHQIGEEFKNYSLFHAFFMSLNLPVKRTGY